MIRITVLTALTLALSGCRPTEVDPEWLAEHTARDLARVTHQVQATEPITNSIGMQLKRIPPGTFIKGVLGESGPGKSRLHYTTVTQPFYLGIYEVTQVQYEKVMGVNPSTFQGADHPVETVSWEDAVEFCRRLSELPEEKSAGRTYRLPMESEWEFACRAGTTTKYSFGNNPADLGEFAWYEGNATRTPHAVGQKRQNDWGFYDMHGNLYEWCQDNLHGHQNQSSGAAFRGGSWREHDLSCDSTYFGYAVPTFATRDLGFRVAADIHPESTAAPTHRLGAPRADER